MTIMTATADPRSSAGSVVARLKERIDAYNKLLGELAWKPSRSHIETSRNLMEDALAALSRALAQAEQVRAAAIEECRRLVEEMTHKHGSPVGPAYENGVWDHGVRISAKFSALAAQPPAAPVETILQFSEDQLKVGVQYIDWDASLDTETEVRQLGEAISRMGKPSFDLDLQRDITASRAKIEQLQRALDNSQSLLAMLHHLGTEFDGIGTNLWNAEGLTKLTADQLKENRMALGSKSVCRSSADIAEARKQAFAAAMDELDKLRTLAATDFKSPNCQGQRGADRTDAFYDAYHAIRKLSEAVQVITDQPQAVPENVAMASALARKLCTFFDSGGESQRSVRARHASAIFMLLDGDSAQHHAHLQQIADDPVGYLEAAETYALSRPHDGGDK